jgi:hypothetical protein
VARYLTDQAIGVPSYLTRLYSPANLSGDAATEATGLTQPQLDALSNTYDITSILQSRPSNAPPIAQNVPIAFNEAAVCTILDITVNAV